MKFKKAFLAFVIIGTLLALQSGCQEQAKTTPQQAKVETKPEVEAKTEVEVKPEVEAKPITQAEDVGTPKIQVEKTVHDFGIMGPSKKKTTQFNFKNIGDGTLKIKKIRSTCGCTVPELKKKEYAPGESGTINVTFRSGTRKGATSKNLYIESNDPVNPKFQLTIKATIKLSIEAKPTRINLSLTDTDVTAPPITIKSIDGKPFAIKSITSTKNVITAEFDPEFEATEIVINPIVNYEALQNNLRGTIKINVTHPLSKQINITYAAKAEFEVLSPRIIIQNAEPGKIEKKDIWITSNYNKKTEIESITVEKGHVKVVSQEPNENDLKIELQITVPEKTGNTRYFSDIVKIKLKTGQSFDVRCNGFYKRQVK